MSRWVRALLLLVVSTVIVMGAEAQAQTPVITGISPASGVVGTQITITGQGLLGSASYNGVVSSLIIGGQTATTTSWTDTQIVATIPSGLPGNSTSVGIYANYNNYYNYSANSNTYTWTVNQPLITAMSPTSGVPGTAVTLTGSGFGASQAASTVTFGGAPATVTSWSNTQIIAVVPSGTGNSQFVVSVPGMSPSDSGYFSLNPYIASITPASGVVGTQITITGQGLLPTGANGIVSSLMIGGQAAATSSWTNTQIVATIPAGIPGNSTSVGIYANFNNYYNYAANSNTYIWTVNQPLITAMSPTSGTPSTSVTLTGSGFGAMQGASTVTFSGTAAVVTSWSNTQIVATVPSGTGSGAFVVSVPGMSPSSSSVFTLTPYIASITPTSGVVGTQITITGQGLLPSGANGIVSSLMIGGQAAATSSWTNTQIVATIPSGLPGNSTSVGIYANYNNYYNYSANSNTYIWTVNQPQITSMSPSTGYPGTAVTLTGSGFGASQGASTVTFGGIAATVTSWSNTQIIALVPSGTGNSQFVVSVPGMSPSNSGYFSLNPYIASITPAFGVAGTQITIIGQGLLPSGANGIVSSLMIGGQAATTSSWTNTQIVATIPAGIPGNSTSVGIYANFNNYYNYVANSNTYIWTVNQPLITAMSPTSGVPGTAVTLTGSGFGATQGTGAVTFGGVAATVTSWNNTQIVAVVPSGTGNSQFVVSVPGMSPSNSGYFSLTPYIASITPASGVVGTQITITGQGLLPSGANGIVSSLMIGGQTATTSSWTNTQIVATIPSGLPGNSTSVPIYANYNNYYNYSANSNTYTWTVSKLNVASLSPASGPVGSAVTIIGTGFGVLQGASTVSFNGMAGSPSSWSDTLVVVTVPTGATTGNVVVSVNGVAASASYTVTQASPSITATGSLNVARSMQTSTLLSNGKELIVGGYDSTYNVVSSAELYDPTSATFSLTGSLTTARQSHTATLLPNGQVLISGGVDNYSSPVGIAELFDPGSGTFSAGATLNTARSAHTATVLHDGRVLIVGGHSDRWTVLSSAEIYDPATGSFTSTGNLNSAREYHTATLLPDGQVLISGGLDNSFAPVPISELFDPGTGSFSYTGTMNIARQQHTATLLDTGQVLLVGGIDTSDSNLTAAELYDPASGTFSSTASLNTERVNHTATLLSDGTVLIGGGQTNRGVTGSTELYDPVAGTFSYSSSLLTARQYHTATMLGSGVVLITGGIDANYHVLAQSELYQPANLIPSGLVSLALTPTGSAISAGSIVRLSAIGTFADGTTKVLASAVWSSSDNTIATVTSDAGDYGYVFGVGAGTVTLAACEGSLCGQTAVMVGSSAQALPTITSLSATTGPVGTPVTITGANFGAVQGQVTFNGVAATVSSWSTSQVSVVVPQGAITGSVLVIVAGIPSNEAEFTVTSTPSITSLSPASGRAGTAVVINGHGFGPSQESGTVTFNGVAATPTSWTDTQILTLVPSAATTGNVVVSTASTASNGMNFTVPTVVSIAISPANPSVYLGTTFQLTALGTLSDGTTEDVTSIAAWSSSMPSVATVQCYSGGGSASVIAAHTSNKRAMTHVTANDNWWACAESATALAVGQTTIQASVGDIVGSTTVTVPGPTVTSLSPTSGTVGTLVTIAGSNFGSAQGGGPVTFNGTACTVLAWSSGSITVAVPPGATTGSVVVTTGEVSSNGISFAVLPGGFVATGGLMTAARDGQTATRLGTGDVLIAGGLTTSGVVNSAELYTPSSQVFIAANSMNVSRWLHTATLLNDGTVLVAGGSDLVNRETLDSVEIYNPSTGTFTLLSNTLNIARAGHTATLLNNGQVLFIGGYDPETGLIADAELYDPPTQTFIDLGDTNSPRYEHTSTMLQNGEVLIAGGEMDRTPSAAYNTAELYDPASQTFTPVPVPMTTPREGHTAALLNNGQVLITGGDIPGTGSLNTAELYTPTSGTFTAIASTMTVPRISHTMTLLNGGKVLIDGGATDSPGSSTVLNTAELYDPASQTFVPVGAMASAREHQTASLLNDGTVLVTGGTDGNSVFNTADIYTSSQLNGLTSIAIAPSTSSIGAGAQQPYTAVGTFSDGSTESLASVLWNSSVPSVATISGDATNAGVGSALAQGTTTITARAARVSGSAALTVTTPTLVSIALSPQGPTIPMGTTQQFTVIGVYTDGSTQDLTAAVTWSVPTSVVAAINGNGLAAGLFQGTATVQARMGVLSASTTLTVAAPALISIAITPAAATIALGGSQQYQAMGTYSDGSTQNLTTLLTWSSGTPAVATVTSNGVVKGVSQGSATLTAGFESVSVSFTVTVTAPTLVSISVTPNAASLSVGATQQLSATGTYTDGSLQNLTASSTWTSSNSNVVSISNSGLATAIAYGNATLSVASGAISSAATAVVSPGTAQANLNTSRYQQNATILNNGQILVAGGVNCPTAGSCTYLSSAELYNPGASTFTYTGAMATARSAPAVLLNNGKVLVAGGYTCDGSVNCLSLNSAEIYDPSTGVFAAIGAMTMPRSGHTMTVLANGTVLIAGGEACDSSGSCTALSGAEIYDPASGIFTSVSGGMSAARFGASAVLLNSGAVLIVGGSDGTNLPVASETYSPVTAQFAGPGPSLNISRFNPTATLLNSGQVLVAGGSTCGSSNCPTNAAEVFDPVTNTFSAITVGMVVPRLNHSATLLTSGNVLMAGGYSSCGAACNGEASIEVFDPVAGTFSSGQAEATALAGHTATLLANGNVLLIGGINAGITLADDEWYQPTSFTPTGLVSVTVAPANFFLMPGQTQQLTATGTFNDGSTQILQSVIWNSSSPLSATISNSSGSAGIANAQATGATTLTATAGDIGGSASLNAAQLVSLTIAPSNPSISVGSGQQLTAAGTFSDGSVQDVTSRVTWSSSNNAIVLIATGSTLRGFAMGAASGTATITAALEGVQITTSVIVQAVVAPTAPTITAVSPTAGVTGMQITISGSGFGTTHGSGGVWLGSTYGTVVNWNDTQIVATVAANSTSGTAQVRQGGLSSNAVPFSVNTATISYISPASGVPGTQVTVNGSGFGAAPGSGQVFLGTTNAAVQSWSDSQVVAVVATGSISGSAQILQNGVMSNAVPFAVNSLNITGVTPNSGGPGTSVTITGTGFGSSQGNGTVSLGSTNGQVVSWSNTQIIAVVAPYALTGIVRIQQNDTWSNAVNFTVPSADGSSLTIEPNLLNLVVGEAHAIQAIDASGQPVTGLTWTSSDPSVLSLSTDDPPILTVVSAGHATVTATAGASADFARGVTMTASRAHADDAEGTTGGASADITAFDGTLPLGTVIWSDSGDGSGITQIVPAIPSVTGVADVFAFQSDGTVQAIQNDGTPAWTANIGGTQALPDFQGGLVVTTTSGTPSITKLDGITGQPVSTYTPQFTYPTNVLVHPDGTIFSLEPIRSDNYSTNGQPITYAVVGIDPATGSQKFSLQLDQSMQSSKCTENGIVCAGSPSTSYSPASVLGTPIIAGDGYAYVAYIYSTSDAELTVSSASCDACQVTWTFKTETNTVWHLVVIRVGTDGSSSKIDVNHWTSNIVKTEIQLVAPGVFGGLLVSDSVTTVQSGPEPILQVQMITIADTGVMLSWELDTIGYCGSLQVASTYGWGTQTSYSSVCNAQVTPSSTFGVATIAGGSFGSWTPMNIPGQGSPITPVLQAQDGTFVGTVGTGSTPYPDTNLPMVTQTNMVGFDSSAKVKYSVPNETPKVATADNGVIGSAGVIYDSVGNAVGKVANEVQSWTANEYQKISNAFWRMFTPPAAPATPPYSSFAGSNQSANATSPLCHDSRDTLIAEYGTYRILNSSYPKPYPRFTPNCFELTNSAHSQYFSFSDISSDPWALIKFPLIAPASAGYGLDKWIKEYGETRIINSGYRDPAHNAAIGGKPASRHMLGDAVDLQNESCPSSSKPCTSAGLQEWQEMVKAAGNAAKRTGAQADYVEPATLKCKYNCVHADWRYHDLNKYAH